MENVVLQRLSEEITKNNKVALAMITKVAGSSPGPEGAMAVILEDGTIIGTVGGGKLEAVTIEKAKKCMEEGKNGYFTFELNNKDVEESIHMTCGGRAEVYIRVFNPKNKLILVGGGHISHELYKLGKYLGFYTVIFEDREQFANRERFPEADEIMLGDVAENLRNYTIDDSCYIVLVSRGHAYDEIALREVINSKAKYIGMIGSRNKVRTVFNNMRNEGVSEEALNRVYSPIGLSIGNETPNEIAMSIMAEILLIKNNGQLAHLKDIKR
jgi:xanthine dehydrogenase accessory factor